MPYWDWASQKTEIVPQIALNPDYREKGPKSTESITEKGIEDYNPLFEFRFPQGISGKITVSARISISAMAIPTYPEMHNSAAHL